MDKRERTLNAMRGLPVDRVPTTFYRHLTAFGNDEESMIAGQVRSFHDSEMDFLVEETDGYMEYPLPGGDPKDLASWKGNIGLSRNHPFFTEQIERTRRCAMTARSAEATRKLLTPMSSRRIMISSYWAAPFSPSIPPPPSSAPPGIPPPVLTDYSEGVWGAERSENCPADSFQ